MLSIRSAYRLCARVGIVARRQPTDPLVLCRPFSAATPDEVQATIDKINDLFVEARDEIEFAQEDAETTYFNESCTEAKELVATVIGEYDALLGAVDETERGRIQRSMGMKMEQLKAELQQLDTLHAD